ncbi:hypothetical protein BC828DRAFT_403687 [Blastocladiella britannica]|nr:hypothetical protein BC828DRAFT_403687 [Blastocladiella britannica]
MTLATTTPTTTAMASAETMPSPPPAPFQQHLQQAQQQPHHHTGTAESSPPRRFWDSAAASTLAPDLLPSTPSAPITNPSDRSSSSRSLPTWTARAPPSPPLGRFGSTEFGSNSGSPRHYAGHRVHPYAGQSLPSMSSPASAQQQPQEDWSLGGGHPYQHHPAHRASSMRRVYSYDEDRDGLHLPVSPPPPPPPHLRGVVADPSRGPVSPTAPWAHPGSPPDAAAANPYDAYGGRDPRDAAAYRHACHPHAYSHHHHRYPPSYYQQLHRYRRGGGEGEDDEASNDNATTTTTNGNGESSPGGGGVIGGEAANSTGSLLANANARQLALSDSDLAAASKLPPPPPPPPLPLMDRSPTTAAWHQLPYSGQHRQYWYSRDPSGAIGPGGSRGGPAWSSYEDAARYSALSPPPLSPHYSMATRYGDGSAGGSDPSLPHRGHWPDLLYFPEHADQQLYPPPPPPPPGAAVAAPWDSASPHSMPPRPHFPSDLPSPDSRSSFVAPDPRTATAAMAYPHRHYPPHHYPPQYGSMGSSSSSSSSSPLPPPPSHPLPPSPPSAPHHSHRRYHHQYQHHQQYMPDSSDQSTFSSQQRQQQQHTNQSRAVPPRSKMITWTPAELSALEDAVRRLGTKWATIWRMHGPAGEMDRSLGRFPTPLHLSNKAFGIVRTKRAKGIPDHQIGVFATMLNGGLGHRRSSTGGGAAGVDDGASTNKSAVHLGGDSGARGGEHDDDPAGAPIRTVPAAAPATRRPALLAPPASALSPAASDSAIDTTSSLPAAPLTPLPLSAPAASGLSSAPGASGGGENDEDDRSEGGLHRDPAAYVCVQHPLAAAVTSAPES